MDCPPENYHFFRLKGSNQKGRKDLARERRPLDASEWTAKGKSGKAYPAVARKARVLTSEGKRGGIHYFGERGKNG